MGQIDEFDDDGLNPREMAEIADQAIRDLFRTLYPDCITTGKFVILAETMEDEEAGALWFIEGIEQAEWDTRGLLDWAKNRLSMTFIAVKE